MAAQERNNQIVDTLEPFNNDVDVDNMIMKNYTQNKINDIDSVGNASIEPANRLDASQDGEVAVKTTTPSTDIAEIRSNNNDVAFENLASVVTNMGQPIDYEASPKV